METLTWSEFNARQDKGAFSPLSKSFLKLVYNPPGCIIEIQPEEIREQYDAAQREFSAQAEELGADLLVMNEFVADPHLPFMATAYKKNAAS